MISDCSEHCSALRQSCSSSLPQYRPLWLATQRRRREGRSVRQALNCRGQAVVAPPEPVQTQRSAKAQYDTLYDAIVVGGGMGGLTAATQLASEGAKVIVLEKYTIPGGSAGHFQRKGFIFDVGSSMMFGMGQKGTTNLITRALAAVGKSLETAPDPTQIHYHLPRSQAHPQGLDVKVWRDYEEFIAELTRAFPHEKAGIRKFYGECWRVFNALNTLELKSLEEPRYLLGEFAKHPVACLTLASFLATNAGDVARRHIRDPELLRFIDIECYCWSTVPANMTPMINAGMVFCDRHYGGINYPKGGVGLLGEALADGLQEHGGNIQYKTNVSQILTEGKGKERRAVGVRLSDGKVLRGRTVISNATHWDTFDRLLPQCRHDLPHAETKFRQRYKKSPAFLTVHAGVSADAIPPGTQCHHIVVEDWDRMEEPHGTLFVSLPSVLDPSLCPPGTHIVHMFTPDWIEEWQDTTTAEYKAKKEAAADAIMDRLDFIAPGLRKATVFREVGTPRTHRRFLGRQDGSYGPIPSRRPLGMLGMPFNRTGLKGLYCVGDSTFPGQGVNAVVFSGFGCAHRVLCDLGKKPTIPVLDTAFNVAFGAIRDRV